jgi:hypothetical protein
MNGKRARNIRKLLNLKLPVEPDLRIGKKVNKMVYFDDGFGGTKAQKAERISIVNAAKAQYRQVKKRLKGQTIPNISKDQHNTEANNG